MGKYLHEDLSKIILSCFYTVYNELGYGFLEKVYKNALKHELQLRGLCVEEESAISVFYKRRVVGVYYADLIVNGCIILELKAAESLCSEHEYQLINYLKATNFQIGLLLNFGKTPQVKRKIFETARRK